MHILLIHQNFAALNEPGGTRHHELARYLVENGHRVSIICSPVSYLTGASQGYAKPEVEVEQQGRLTIRRVATYTAMHRSFFHRVISFLSFMVASFREGLKIKEVDVVWGTSPPIFQGVTALTLARLKRAPFVFEVRDLWPAFAVAVGVLKQPLLIRASEWLERFLYKHADRIIVNSPGFIDHVKKHGAGQIELIPNGSDPRMFDPETDGASFRASKGWENCFIALYAGAHGLSNDLGVVLQAGQYLKDRPDIRIVLVGDGKDKPALKTMAAEMGLENVSFLPPVPKSEMNAILAGVDACLAILKPIRLYNTVYPNKVFDYMAAGKPVVLAIGGVIRQVIEESEAGLPISPGDPLALATAIRALADDRPRSRQMGQNGRKFVETHFDRAVLAEKLARVFYTAREERKRS